MPFLTCYLPRYFFTFKTMVVPLCLTPEEKQELDAKGYLVSPTFTFKTMVVPLYPKELRDRLETYVFQNHPGAIMPVRPGNVHVFSTFLSKPWWCRYARVSIYSNQISVHFQNHGGSVMPNQPLWKRSICSSFKTKVVPLCPPILSV